ncbi:hypothetical protein C8J57DRAFT_1020861, partial [Mycena rebaudengoi]
IGGGFIAAGLRGAIGIIWTMKDADRPVVAETVYSRLFGNGQRPDASAAVETLHLAIQRLNNQAVLNEGWIPFIHIG